MSDFESTNRPEDLAQRVALIESMLTEGRRTTAHWSWTFVLWGLAYLAALSWSMWGPHAAWAWPVCMIAGGVLTFVFISMSREKAPCTTMGRAIGSIWIALGISMATLFFSLAFAGRLTDVHTFVALVAGFLGMANGASALLLRWKAQLACAVAWWMASAAACFGSDTQAIGVFAAAVMVCQLGFGVYAMAHEARDRRRSGAAHA